jgi:hypothetical protein
VIAEMRRRGHQVEVKENFNPDRRSDASSSTIPLTQRHSGRGRCPAWSLRDRLTVAARFCATRSLIVVLDLRAQADRDGVKVSNW